MGVSRRAKQAIKLGGGDDIPGLQRLEHRLPGFPLAEWDRPRRLTRVRPQNEFPLGVARGGQLANFLFLDAQR